MSETTNQITRREILKRGAFVGGAVVWATPVVQTLGMGRAFAATPSDTCVPSWASQWKVFDQKGHKDPVYDPIPDWRSHPSNTLGEPTYPPNETFASLGYGGVLIVELATPYYSGKLGEAVVVETTYTAPDDFEEKAKVAVAQDLGGPFYDLPGFATNKTSTTPVKTELPIDGYIPGSGFIVRYVRLTDITDDPYHPGNADGFDVNAVGISCPGTNPQ